MHKEIGSNFWLNRYEKLGDTEINLDYLHLNFSDIAYLSTGRSAISLVLENLKLLKNEKVALLPSFTCHTVIEPFISAGYRVFYYQIDKDLTCNKEEFLKDIQEYNPSVVLVHGYFGFNTLQTIKDALKTIKDRDIKVIEDITQTMYSTFEHTESNYYVSSFRKWFALPDGGCAISATEPFLFKPIEVDKRLVEAKLTAFHAKYLYMTQDVGVKREFLKMLHDAEQILSEQETMYSMSSVSKTLQGNLDIEYLRSCRRNNFNILINGLINIDIVEPIFESLPEEVTPLYFPVYVKCNRRELQNYLAKKDIYAPVIWPKPAQCEGEINAEVDWIYNNILAIPCDQRYGIDDMERILKSIEDYTVSLLEERETK